MNSNWRNFLQQQDAVFDADRVLRFGNAGSGLPVGPPTAIVADLSGDYGMIAAEGPEAHSFLQGQLSTHVPGLTPALSQFSSWSNAKGRVVTMLHVLDRDGRILLVLPKPLAATVLKRLSLYVLRTKVTLTDISDTLVQFGLAGANAAELLAACGLSAPSEINAVTDSRGVQLLRLHGATPRYAVIGKAPQLQPLWTTLEDHGAHPAGSDVWTLLRILAGEPELHPETSEHFVAQMLGLEELGAVHFNKGCYLGQEVIARAHYRGAVKRHLHRAECNSTGTLRPGMDIQTTSDTQPVGEIVDACPDASDAWQMLVVLKDEFVSVPLQINGSPVRLSPGN